MIDLHCHLLPGIDDGPRDLAASLDMARMAVADGVLVTACTPHITPGVYNNDGESIQAGVDALVAALADAAIPLQLVAGADAHIAPDLAGRLAAGAVPTLAGSRYFLLEPPTNVPPPGLVSFVSSLTAAGYLPIVTHPERLAWIETRYDLIRGLVARGASIQLTAGSLVGRFGRRSRYWAERMLDDDIVHVIATDAHDTRDRPPRLSVGRDAVARRCGDARANLLVVINPLRILKDAAIHPASLSPDRPKRRIPVSSWGEWR